MKDEVIVTILLPVYNGEKTLSCAINSLLRQTLLNFELLILDDGSSDQTLNLVNSFADSRIKIIADGEHRGLASRLNQGINLAKGRYIARMDADDVSFPERLKIQFDFLEAHPNVDLLGCRALAFFDQDKIIGTLPFAATHEDICAYPWRAISLPHPTWMGRAEWFRKNQYALPEVIRAEDQELLLRTYPYSRFACLNEILLGYRQGEFKLSKTLIARRSLLNAQIHLFKSRGEWKNLLLVIWVTFVKVIVDILASIPGFKNLFFLRMAGKAPIDAQLQLKKILSKS